MRWTCGVPVNSSRVRPLRKAHRRCIRRRRSWQAKHGLQVSPVDELHRQQPAAVRSGLGRCHEHPSTGDRGTAGSRETGVSKKPEVRTRASTLCRKRPTGSFVHDKYEMLRISCVRPIERCGPVPCMSDMGVEGACFHAFHWIEKLLVGSAHPSCGFGTDDDSLECSHLPN